MGVIYTALRELPYRLGLLCKEQEADGIKKIPRVVVTPQGIFCDAQALERRQLTRQNLVSLLAKEGWYLKFLFVLAR